MFGYNTISIDQKHRVSIPAKYRVDFLKTNETESFFGRILYNGFSFINSSILQGLELGKRIKEI